MRVHEADEPARPECGNKRRSAQDRDGKKAQSRRSDDQKDRKQSQCMRRGPYKRRAAPGRVIRRQDKDERVK
ncbi:hypothetical protein C8R44DRAFT_823237 [Mycena epipterygia]|nr:hypothetical protein C8R44DRAFT_823237 [Mycena epipterygia]